LLGAVVQGKAVCWGDGGAGSLGLGTTSSWGFTAGQMSALNEIPFSSTTLVVTQISSRGGSTAQTCVLFTNKRALCWGFNQYGVCGDGSTTTLLGPVNTLNFFINDAATPAKQVLSLFGSTCLLLETGMIQCFGDNGYGVLGRGTIGQFYPFALATAIVFDQPTITATQITGKSTTICGLFSNQRARCWGWNNQGQLGQGTTKNPFGTSPSDMTSLPFISFSDATATLASISLYNEHACVVFSSPAGRIACWGFGFSGELGTGAGLNIGSNPTDMTSLGYIIFSSTDPAVAVSAGVGHTCALFQVSSSLNRARCWGRFGSGLGYNNNLYIGNVPGQMSVLGYISFLEPTLSVVQVEAGGSHSCAVFANDRIRCWGTGVAGELGQDSTVPLGNSALTNPMSSIPFINVLQRITPSFATAQPAFAPLLGGSPITLTGANLETTRADFVVSFFCAWRLLRQRHGRVQGAVDHLGGFAPHSRVAVRPGSREHRGVLRRRDV
jgi:alpha-tubulin suppressor-like RCC1 family protein